MSRDPREINNSHAGIWRKLGTKGKCRGSEAQWRLTCSRKFKEASVTGVWSRQERVLGEEEREVNGGPGTVGLCKLL